MDYNGPQLSKPIVPCNRGFVIFKKVYIKVVNIQSNFSEVEGQTNTHSTVTSYGTVYTKSITTK